LAIQTQVAASSEVMVLLGLAEFALNLVPLAQATFVPGVCYPLQPYLLLAMLLPRSTSPQVDRAADAPHLQEDVIIDVIVATICRANPYAEPLIHIHLNHGWQIVAVMLLPGRNDHTGDHLCLHVDADVHLVPMKILWRPPLYSVLVPYRSCVIRSPVDTRIPRMLPFFPSVIVLLHIHVGLAMRTVDQLQGAEFHTLFLSDLNHAVK